MTETEKALIERLGLTRLTEEEQKQIVNQITEVLNGRVVKHIYEQLDSETKGRLDQSIENQNEEEVMKILRGTVDNFDKVVTEELNMLLKEVERDVEYYKEQARQEISQT